MAKNYEKYGVRRDEVLEKLRQAVKPKRYEHCLGVEKTARKLAKQYGCDKDLAGLTGLLHDYAKELTREEFFALIDKYELDESLKSASSNVWHGIVGIYKIHEDLGIPLAKRLVSSAYLASLDSVEAEDLVDDSPILEAIRVHTVGKPDMALLDKIVYVADYIEPGRSFDGVEEARKIAAKSLDAAVLYETARTVEYLAARELPIFPATLDTYNFYVNQKLELEP